MCPGSSPRAYQFFAPEEIDLEYTLGEGKVMVNVGSVGQPRDGDNRACYVILEDGLGDEGSNGDGEPHARGAGATVGENHLSPFAVRF